MKYKGFYYRETEQHHIFSTSEDENNKVWMVNKPKTKRQAFQIVLDDIIEEYNYRSEKFREEVRQQ